MPRTAVHIFLKEETPMKRWICLAFALLGALHMTGMNTAQNNAPEPRWFTLGEVSKIDSKAKLITIKDAVSYDITQLPSGDGRSAPVGARRSGGGGGGGGGGRGGRRGGGGGTAG